MLHFLVYECFVFLFSMIWSNKEWRFISYIYFYFYVGVFPYFILRLNASLYLNNISITSPFSLISMPYLNLCISLISFCLSYTFSHLWDLAMDNLLLICPLGPFSIYKCSKVFMYSVHLFKFVILV